MAKTTVEVYMSLAGHMIELEPKAHLANRSHRPLYGDICTNGNNR